jgi:hypothetical protein
MRLLASLLAVGAADEVRFEIRTAPGAASSAGPVVASAVLAPGRFRDGEICGVVRAGRDGLPQTVPLQVNVLSRHADGTVQHALLAASLDLAPGTVQELFLVPSPAPPLAGPFAPAAGGSGAPPVAIELVDHHGVHWSAIVEPPHEPPAAHAVAGAASAAAGQVARALPLLGPLAREFEIESRLRSAAGELPRLRVIVRWRELASVPGARIEVVVENCLLDAGPGAPPDDVPFRRLAVVAGDDVLCDLADGVVWDRTRFAVRRPVGGAPPAPQVRQDLAWLEMNGWLPPFDASHPLAPSVADAAARRIVSSRGNGEVDGARFECGIPLDPGPIARYMPGTGDRPDIGPIPTWAALALNSRGRYAQDVLFAADQNGAGSFPIHVRGADGAMGVEHPAGKALKDRKGTRKCPQVPDRAHAPLLGYVTWLMTGEWLAMEELAAQASYCLQEWPHDGRYRYPGSRDFAWSLRTTMLAAKLLPDSHPRKAWLRERVASNLGELRSTIEKSESPLHAWGSGSFRSSGRKSWPCATQWSPWQGAWVAAACEWTARLHGNDDARFLWEWQAEYFTRAYADVGTTFTAPEGTTVRWESGHHALAYSFPVATYVPERTPDGWEEEPGSRRFIGSFAEALWWLRINGDHEFEPGNSPQLAMTADGRAIRPPADWRPAGAWAPPEVPAASWITYAMHWFRAVAVADGRPGAAALDAAVGPVLERSIEEPGLRLIPRFARPPR